ncbi:hypothetical protein HS125_14450 [bacterium]|nr:hypothetical protein [bacterium]
MPAVITRSTLAVCLFFTCAGYAGQLPAALRGEYHRPYPAAAADLKTRTPRAAAGPWQVATLPLGPLAGNLLGPAELAIDSARHRLYVSARFSDCVAVVDTNVNCVIAKIPVGLRPVGIALDADAEVAFVACNLSDAVYLFDTRNYEVLGYIPVGRRPQGLAYDPTRRKLYVGNTLDDTVTVIDLLSAAPPATLRVGAYPFALRYLPGPDRVVVVNASSNTVHVINPAGDVVDATLVTGRTPVDAAYDDARARLYVSCYTDGVVKSHSLDGSHSSVLTAPGATAWGLDYDPDRQWLFIGVEETHRIRVFDTVAAQYVREVPASVEPQGLRLDLSRGMLYNANSGSDLVIAYDIAADEAQNILTGQDPTDLAMDGDSNALYVSVFGSNDILGIDGSDLSLIYRQPVGLSPHGLALDGPRDRLAVINWNDNSVTFHRATDGRLLAKRNGRAGPWDLALNQPGDKWYVSGRLSGMIATYSGTNVSDRFTAQFQPTGLAKHPSQDLLYVCDSPLGPGQLGRLIAFNLPSYNPGFIIPAGTDPIGVAVDADRQQVYWANSDLDTLGFAHALTGAATGSVPVAAGPVDVLADGAGQRLFLSNFLADRVSVLRTTSGTPELEHEIAVGASPWRLAYNPVSRTAYVGNRNSGTLSILSNPTDPGRTPPAAPAGLSARASGKRVILNWDQVNNPEVVGLDVYRSEVTSTDFVRVNPSRLAASTTEFVDPHVVYGLPYTYAVVARDRFGLATPVLAAATTTITPQEVPSAGFRVVIDDFVRVAGRGETVEYPAVVESYGGWSEPVHLECYVENGEADVEILPGKGVIASPTGTPVRLRVRASDAAPTRALGGILRGESGGLAGLDRRAPFCLVVRPDDRPDFRVLLADVGRSRVGAFEKQVLLGRTEPPPTDGRRYSILVFNMNEAWTIDPAGSEAVWKLYTTQTDRLGFFQQEMAETQFGFYRAQAYMAADETSYVAQTIYRYYGIERGVSRLFLGTDAPDSATGTLDARRALSLEGRVIGRQPDRSSVQLEVVSPSGRSVKIPALLTNDAGRFGVALPFANAGLPIPPITLDETGWYRVTGANVGSYYFVASQSDPLLLPVGAVSGADWKAVIVTGLSSVAGDKRNEAARAGSDAVYRALSDRRFGLGDIYWLGDPADSRVLVAPSVNALDSALSAVGDGGAADDPLLVHLCGHGIPGADPGLLLSGTPASGEVLRRSQLAAMLNAFANTHPIVVILDFNDAGSWITALAGPNRAVLAACDTGEEAYVAAGGRLSFSTLLATALRSSAPLGKAFSETRGTLLGIPALFRQSPRADFAPGVADRIVSYPNGLPNVPPAFGAGQLSRMVYSGEALNLVAQVSDPDGRFDVRDVLALVVAGEAPTEYGPEADAGLRSPEVAHTVVPLMADSGSDLYAAAASCRARRALHRGVRGLRSCGQRGGLRAGGGGGAAAHLQGAGRAGPRRLRGSRPAAPRRAPLRRLRAARRARRRLPQRQRRHRRPLRLFARLGLDRSRAASPQRGRGTAPARESRLQPRRPRQRRGPPDPDGGSQQPVGKDMRERRM